MATNQNPSPNNNAAPILLPEIGPDGLARESPAIAYTEKVCFRNFGLSLTPPISNYFSDDLFLVYNSGFQIIEEEQLQLRKYGIWPLIL